MKATLAEKFYARINKVKAGCHLWTGGFHSSGYGMFYSSNYSAVRAHRFSYELHKGPVPNGMYVLHTCDVRACVNPDHLWLGTHDDNMADMGRKGRTTTKGVPAMLAARAKATHCRNGHEYLTDRPYGIKGMRCLVCKRQIKDRQNAKERENYSARRAAGLPNRHKKVRKGLLC